MSADKRALLKQWLESGKARLEPLTLTQRELWETSPVPVADMANHICCVIHVRGAISAEDCRSAVQRVVERQEVLRLSILPGKERPVQMIRDSGEPNLRYRELSGADATPEGVENVARQIFAERFDLVQGPLYRAEVLRRAVDEHVLVFAIHHAIADGWTLGVFVQDLCAAYALGKMGLRDPLPAVPQTYAAWGAGERAYWTPAEIEARASFWKTYLEGRRRLWSTENIPAASAPERWVTHLPADLAEGVRDVAKKAGATLFNTLLAAFRIALSQWTGEADVLVGTPVANRSKQAVRETMGSFAGIVPLRGRVEKDRPFVDGLREVHRDTVDCFAQAMPFVELVRTLGEPVAPGYNPLFQVRFALQNHPIPDASFRGLSFQLRMRSTGTARFDLGCEVTEQGEELEVVWLSRKNLFSRTQIEELDRLYRSVLGSICRSPESRMSVLTP